MRGVGASLLAVLLVSGCVFSELGAQLVDTSPQSSDAGVDRGGDSAVDAPREQSGERAVDRAGGGDAVDGQPFETSVDASIDGPQTDATIDGGGGPLIIQAENTASKSSLDGMHTWMINTTIAGASGSRSIQALPDQPGKNCVNNVTSCGCVASYTFNRPVAQNYWMHFRTYAISKSRDSFHFKVNTRNDRSANISAIGQWVVVSRQAPMLQGPNTLRVYMRENGAVIDAIAISTSNQPPVFP